MTDQSGSSHFRSLFESALQSYEKQSGVVLAEHPLAVQLQTCHSVESVVALLQGQAQAFGDFRGSDRAMKSIGSTVSLLTRLASIASLGDAIGFVRQC
jgi:hypothetical protein